MANTMANDALTPLLPCSTPTVRSSRHVPGYVEKGEAIKEKGIDDVYCIAGNDAFVMDAWSNPSARARASRSSLTRYWKRRIVVP